MPKLNLQNREQFTKDIEWRKTDARDTDAVIIYKEHLTLVNCSVLYVEESGVPGKKHGPSTIGLVLI